MGPCVVSAVKSGAVLPIDNVMASLLCSESRNGGVYTPSIGLFEVGFDVLRLHEPFRRREPFGTQEFGIVEPRLITRAGIAEDGDDGLSGTEFASQPDGAGDVDARG